jgi:hypothetical protein
MKIAFLTIFETFFFFLFSIAEVILMEILYYCTLNVNIFLSFKIQTLIYHIIKVYSFCLCKRNLVDRNITLYMYESKFKLEIYRIFILRGELQTNKLFD